MAENKQAAQIANDQLAPLLAEIKRQEQAEAERARNAQATAGAGAQGLAGVLKGIAPQTQETYQAAAGSQAAYGAGFSAAFQAASTGSASDLNDFLAKQGSPQQVQSAAANGGADVLYGLGGYIPASSLNREGAAFTAAAQQLPGHALERGQMEQQGIRADSRDMLRKLGESRTDLNAKRPGLYRQALQDLEESKRADRALNINEQYLLNSLRNTGAQITGIDPLTGEPTADVQAAASAAQVKAREKKAASVAKRNNATVEAIDGATDLVEKKLAPGFQENIVGNEPVVLYKRKVGKEERTFYAKKGGGTTLNPAEAVTRPVYAKVPVRKPQYDATYRQVVKYLRSHLGGYGYKPKDFARMADDLLGDYYQIVGGEAPNPTKKRPGSGPASSPR